MSGILEMEEYGMIELKNEWRLYPIEKSGAVKTPQELAGRSPIPAAVPGNVELDLIRAGRLPQDIFKGMHITEAEAFELYDWWYETTFATPQHSRNLILRFEGVDCIAEYWLNGNRIGVSDNALVEFEFDITGYAAPTGGTNHLFVRIKSAAVESNHMEYDLFNIAGHWNPDVDGISLRKPQHAFGWDIMPRAVTAGIWRKVFLYEKELVSIKQINYHMLAVDEEEAAIRFLWELEIPDDLLKADLSVRIHAKCGASEFSAAEKVYFKLGRADVTVAAPKLWWPFGYGQSNVYDTRMEVVLDGRVVAEKSFNVGIRTAKLVRTDTTDGKNGKFEFVINGVRVICKGTNWVPLSPYHSCDHDRYDRALALVKDIGCNIVRCWGGGVYEEECFYDFCDRNGIMVWQDFSLACAAYSQSAAFCARIEEEAIKVVRRLRTHPALILWAGDNECDVLTRGFGGMPERNVITRKILPNVVRNNDTQRDYLPSSPLLTHETIENIELMPEEHLWGPRDYYKSDFYKQSKAHFVSETGYYGCPGAETLKRFLDADKLYPYPENEQWNLHSTDQRNRPYFTKLVVKSVAQMFGEVPDDLEQFCTASQIVHAEAFKYFVERVRCDRNKSGVIWWNLLDGWPQISNALVDYYFEKKLAYDYVKRAQQPFALMFDELRDWNYTLIAANDTLAEKAGTYKVLDVDDGAVLAQGAFCIGKNTSKALCKLEMTCSEQRFLIIEWTVDNCKFYNHYLCGMPAFALERYMRQLEKFNAYMQAEG